MNAAKRKLLIGVFAVLLIAGIWLAYAYFISTRAAIRHAEEFLFRRMTVSQLSDEGHHRFFLVTNRQLDSGDEPLEERFGADRVETMRFGSFDASIEPTLGLGMMINPTAWFQNEEINLSKVQMLETEEFVDRLQGFVGSTPRQSLLIVIHGFREGFDSAMRKTTFVASMLDINTPVLLFDWPGNQGSSLRGYRRARIVAEESGADLAQAIEFIVREIEPERLSLVANSMGAEVVVAAFDQLYADVDPDNFDKKLDHVVLTAPDVDHAEFNEQFKDELTALANDLTVYVSSNDRALLASRIINRGQRLGQSTLSMDQIDEAASILNLVEPGSDVITLVDVTPVNRTRNFHNFSLETPEFYDDLFLRLASDHLPLSRLLYPVRTPEGKVYWVLTRGR